MPLYDYQQEVKAEIYRAWLTGNRVVCAVMPTGAGKSHVCAEIINDGCMTGMRQAVVAHRNELVVQMSCHIAERGIEHRIIGSSTTASQAVRKHKTQFGRSFINPSAPTAVIGVDTLMARKDDLVAWARQVDRWIIDEYHHTIGNDRVEPNKWGRAVQMFVNAHGLGVTATPIRADGQGLGREADGVTDAMILGPSMRYLIERGFLSDYEIVCPRSDLVVDDAPVSKDGDWSNQTLRKAAKKSHIVGDVAENYVKYASGRKAIVFATDVETADEIARRLNEFGIKAASLCAKTQTAFREQCLDEFVSGKLQVLVNVDLFDEGFDVKSCDVCIMARPTASLGKYLQMVGRALRYQPGKVALIIDQVSNVIRHGLPDRHRIWSLNRREKRAKQIKDPDEIPLTTCTVCAKPYEAFRLFCPYCGFQKPLPDPSRRTLEMVEGDLILLDRATLEKMRQETILESAGDVAKRVGAVAGVIAAKGAANRQIEKIEAHKTLSDNIAQWAAVERAHGFTDEEIYRRFYLVAGTDVLSALNAKRTRQEFEEIAELVKGWYIK